jgi:hypothetical protein
MTLPYAKAQFQLEQLMLAAANGESVFIQLEDGREVTISAKAKAKRGMVGAFAGQIWMSDDFDAPLEDFAEYMT